MDEAARRRTRHRRRRWRRCSPPPAWVRSLVLLDTVAFDALARRRDPDDRGPRRRAPRTKEIVERTGAQAFEVGVQHAGALTRRRPRHLPPPWRLPIRSALFRAATRDGWRGPARHRARSLRAHGVPVFVIWGEDDAFYPSSLAERLLDELPGATVALLPGCGHFVTEDAPTTVGPLVFEYLRRWYLGEGHAGHGSRRTGAGVPGASAGGVRRRDRTRTRTEGRCPDHVETRHRADGG